MALFFLLVGPVLAGCGSPRMKKEAEAPEPADAVVSV